MSQDSHTHPENYAEDVAGREKFALNHMQSEDENHRGFLERLMAAGWSEPEAEQEWRNIQDDTEGEL